MTPRTEQHRWVVDAMEEQAASIEVDGGAMITVPRSLLPVGTKQGHVLRVLRESAADGTRSTLTIEIDEAGTRQALADSAKQVDAMRKESATQDPGGDIKL
jgi:hypothetical protein